MILGYLAVFTLCFTITDPSAILNTPTKYPFIQLFYNITNSYVGTDIMVAIIVIALVFAVIAEIATASRQIWSFARDKGLPFSSFLSKVRTLQRAIPSGFFKIPRTSVIIYAAPLYQQHGLTPQPKLCRSHQIFPSPSTQS